LSDMESTKSAERLARAERLESPDYPNERLPRREEEPFFEAESMGDSELPLAREGLPPDYRMRNEHYVDELIATGRMPQLRLVSVGQIERGLSTSANSGEGLEGLVDSIQEFGVLQPLLVRRDRGKYELLSGARRLAAAATAGLKEVPCLVLDVDEIEARRLAEAANRSIAQRASVPAARLPWSVSAASIVEGSFHTILSTLGLLEKPESSMRDQVALGLIRAEALRASRLLQGLRILSSDPPVHRRPLDVGALLQDVLGESEDERALLALELDCVIDEPCSIRADRELLAMSIAGGVECVLSLLRKTRGAKLRTRLARNALSRTASISISEDAVRMPTSSWSRWFDSEWDQRPGGSAAAIALLAARRATELHGGRLDLTPTESGGVRLSLTLPEA
jgi:ParB/Sulfiredoxin domain